MAMAMARTTAMATAATLIPRVVLASCAPHTGRPEVGNRARQRCNHSVEHACRGGPFEGRLLSAGWHPLPGAACLGTFRRSETLGALVVPADGSNGGGRRQRARRARGNGAGCRGHQLWSRPQGGRGSRRALQEQGREQRAKLPVAANANGRTPAAQPLPMDQRGRGLWGRGGQWPPSRPPAQRRRGRSQRQRRNGR